MKVISSELVVTKSVGINVVQTIHQSNDYEVNWAVHLSHSFPNIYKLAIFMSVRLTIDNKAILDCEIVQKYVIENETTPTFEHLQRFVHFSAGILPANYNAIKTWTHLPIPAFGFLQPHDFDELIMNCLDQPL